jgi:transposase
MQTMKPYSEDLRTRIVQAAEGGMSKCAVARLFGVCLSSVKRYLRIAQRGKWLAPRKGGGRPPKGERARCSVARNRGPNTALLASMTAEGVALSWQWKVQRLGSSLRPTSRKFSSRAFGTGRRW